MASNILEFKSIETDLFNVFTAYLKLRTNFTIGSALAAEKYHITLTAYILRNLREDKIAQIIDFENKKVKIAGEESEWENFKYACEEVCKADNVSMINYRFYARGGN